ncbi:MULTISPECIES: XTP/dITP diphosphatase [Pontibacillus]|uniref:dITP/XTP pyrophosphatase n=1 Tax=Pontibacillus chungwhensis TaxID=265426 RepID=A0ABY8UTZ1_9BACI|nr:MULTISPECIES: XTP/dITP diphosphatase [Pontibacillus]MCD5323763.1 XTP/dITP diphosphatase [Pontibacillus sp. HN14]WIF97127.1 XTP/dITP diphosphatase [Pontibacillus chungwhensis]
MKRLVVATHNQGKVREFRQLFSKYDIETLSLEDLNQDVPEVEETGVTFWENAQLKAETISSLLNMPVIADDSGLEVDALEGKPGVYSARYAGEPKNDKNNLEKVLSELNGEQNRKARFVCVLALSLPGEEVIFERGTCEGRLAEQAQGETGFGYDPIFIPDGYNRTMAEIGADEKNKISHRSEALEKIETTIRELLK